MNADEIRDLYREFFVARGHLAGDPDDVTDVQAVVRAVVDELDLLDAHLELPGDGDQHVAPLDRVGGVVRVCDGLGALVGRRGLPGAVCLPALRARTAAKRA